MSVPVEAPRVPARIARRQQHSPERLSPREIDCLRLASLGFDMKEAAHELGISYHTLRQHLRKSYVKLGAADGTHAVAIALRAGVFS